MSFNRSKVLIYLISLILLGSLVFNVIFKSNNVPLSSLDTLRNSYNLDQQKVDDSFPRVDFTESLMKSNRAFWNSTKPSFDCSEKMRIGVDGDGGKWTCGIRTLANRTLQSHYPCVIYSFGVAGESSFEEEVLQISHCEIFAYDMSTNSMGPEVKKDNPRVHFHSQGIAGTSNPKATNMKTLKEFMDFNRHFWIDIVKMDVEQSEYATFDRIFTDFQHLPFGQLLIEIHSFSNWNENRKRIVDLLQKLEDRGMRVFSVEINPKVPDCCSEYSLINIHALKLFGQDAKK